MRSRQRTAGLLLSLGVVLPVAVAAQPTSAAVPASATVTTSGHGGTHKVTLVTGDRLTVAGFGTGNERIAIDPDRARPGISFQTAQVDGHLLVLPSDVLPLLRDDRIDRRLFDVTALIESGYDDAGRADLPLIVTHSAGPEHARTAAALDGAVVDRELAAVRGVAVRIAKAKVVGFWSELTSRPAAESAKSAKLWLDGVRRPVLDGSVQQVGAPVAWKAGYDGAGRTVAVVDSGIDATHPDLAGQVAAARNFTDEDDLDRLGHGTHVASTIAGTGQASDGRYRGVAPGARLLDAKVCTGANTCPDSSIIAGMQWAAEQGADVVNMSLGGMDLPGLDPMELAVQQLTEQYGALFVIAAGNTSGHGTIGSPGSAEAALTVGAVARDESLADFSSRGPLLDGALKPDITAPGVGIVAARSKHGQLGVPGESYVAASGTSMATPHVAGAAAILAQRHPDWSAEQLKATLMGSAAPNPALGPYAQGAGRLDVARAHLQSVTASPGGISFGQFEDRPGEVPRARTVTYRNHGSAAVTLNLAVTATGPDGAAAPAGMFTLAPAGPVTVPPGGEVPVTLTADSRTAGRNGYAGGRITATAAGDIVVQTPFAFERTVDMSELTLRYSTRAGQPTEFASTLFFGLDKPYFNFVVPTAGTATLRLPVGRYLLAHRIAEDELGREQSVFIQPSLDMSTDQSVEVDARRGKPVRVTVPHASARRVEMSLVVRAPRASSPIPVGWSFADTTGSTKVLYTGQIGSPDPVPGLTATLGSTWAKTNDDGHVKNSPYSYHLNWQTRGRMPTGFDQEVKSRDLATVRADYARQAHGYDGAAVTWPWRSGGYDAAVAPEMSFWLPFTRTEYYNTDSGAQWDKLFEDREVTGGLFPEDIATTYQPPAAYEARHTYRQHWNGGVFGPTVAGPRAADQWVSRMGDTISVALPVHADGAGRAGDSTTIGGRTTLFRNGTKIAEEDSLSPSFAVPPEAGSYRLELAAVRGLPHTLSTRVSSVWTFRSAHVDGAAQRLPLSTVRFEPSLDAENTAADRRLHPVRVTVDRQPGSPAGTNRKLTVETSTDDGRTWRAVPVVALHGAGIALVPHPSGPGYVSLRAKATDSAGNTVEQTVIRAYRIA